MTVIPREVAAERRLGELLAVAAAVRPVLDDFTRARIAAKLRRDFDRTRADSQRCELRWIGWELGDIGDVDEPDEPDKHDKPDEPDEPDEPDDGDAPGELHGRQEPDEGHEPDESVPDPSRQWDDDDPERPRAVVLAPTLHAEPAKREPRASWTRRVLLASAAAALSLGALLFDSLRDCGPSEPELLRDPIVTSVERLQPMPLASPPRPPEPIEPIEPIDELR